jgi:hypothetical protein
VDVPAHTPPPAGAGSADHLVTTCLTSGDYSNITRTIPAGFAAATVTGTGELARASLSPASFSSSFHSWRSVRISVSLSVSIIGSSRVAANALVSSR